nr:MAG TPA: hypothetical protein [Caudoviricetes sp.]
MDNTVQNLHNHFHDSCGCFFHNFRIQSFHYVGAESIFRAVQEQRRRRGCYSNLYLLCNIHSILHQKLFGRFRAFLQLPPSRCTPSFLYLQWRCVICCNNDIVLSFPVWTGITGTVCRIAGVVLPKGAGCVVTVAIHPAPSVVRPVLFLLL